MADLFEWDERKRLANVAKHGFDFLDVDLLFAGPHLRAEVRTVGGERRWLATGFINDLPATVVFTYRGDVVRVISIRSARHEERARHQDLFGPGSRETPRSW